MEKQNFIYLILSALKEHYLSSSEITQKLKMDHIDFVKASFILLYQGCYCKNIFDTTGFLIKQDFL